MFLQLVMIMLLVKCGNLRISTIPGHNFSIELLTKWTRDCKFYESC